MNSIFNSPRIICFDTEMTNPRHKEILELSIFNGEYREVFHEYFMPVLSKTWTKTEQVHHISPETVADKPSFESMLSEIQKVFDSASVIVGYDLHNDIESTEKWGVVYNRDKQIYCDVREIYWLIRGRKEGLVYGTTPNLIDCARNLGFDWSSETAHCASSDTKATIFCYLTLMEEFMTSHDELAGSSLEEIVKFCKDKIYEERCNEFANRVNTDIYLIKKTDGYCIQTNPEDESKCVAKIRVNDVNKAKYDISKMFSRRTVPGRTKVWKLRTSDIEAFLDYSNTYTTMEDSMYYAKLFNAAKSLVGSFFK